MKATIEVNDRHEAHMLQVGLSDTAVRAFVVIIGELKPFSARTRARIMHYVIDKLAEDEASRPAA